MILVRNGNQFRIIYLIRKNLFRHAISNIYARYRQEFHTETGSGPTQLPRMRIEFDSLIGWMHASEKLAHYEASTLEGVPHLKIIYEDDLETSDKHQSNSNKIFNYLGIPSSQVLANLNPTTPRDISTIVTNYQEIVDSLQETRFSIYLES